MNPAIMYKDYELDEKLEYFITLSPLYTIDVFYINVTLVEYDTDNRNFEGKGNVLIFGSSATTSTILGYPKEGDESVFYQINNCNESKLNYGIYNNLNEKQLVSNIENRKNYFNKFDNIFSETELKITGIS